MPPFTHSPNAGGGGGSLLSRVWGNEADYYDFATDPGVSWQNQDSAGLSFGTGGAVMTADSANELNVAWLPDILTGNDFIAACGIRFVERGGNNSQVGIISLTGGTIAAPTQLIPSGIYSAASGPAISHAVWTNYTTFSASIGNPYISDNSVARVYEANIILGYDSTAGELYGGLHGDYTDSGTGSNPSLALLGSYDPTRLGLMVTSAGEGTTIAMYSYFKHIDSPANVTTWPLPALIGR